MSRGGPSYWCHCGDALDAKTMGLALQAMDDADWTGLATDKLEAVDALALFLKTFPNS